MLQTSPVNRYGAALRTFHWATVAAIIVVYGVTYLEAFFPRGSAGRATIWWTHISVGLVIVPLVLARLAARAIGPVPPPSAALSRPVHLASLVAHVLLYLLLVATPVVGVYLAFLRGDAVSFFSLFTIPAPIGVDRTLARSVKDVHETLANALVILATLHAAAALAHHFVFKDDVLLRMLPERRSR